MHNFDEKEREKERERERERERDKQTNGQTYRQRIKQNRKGKTQIFADTRLFFIRTSFFGQTFNVLKFLAVSSLKRS